MLVIPQGVAVVRQVPSVQEARTLLAQEGFDLVLLDLELADGKDADLLPNLGADCPVVIFSSSEVAVGRRKATGETP